MKKPNNFFEYEWPVDSKPSAFSVDISHKEAGYLEEYPYLYTISCSSKKDSAKLSFAERFHASHFVNEFLLLTDSVFVGSVSTKAQIRYFFYAKSDSSSAQINAAAKKKKSLNCVVEQKYEPEWDTYFSFLYPTPAKRQTEDNRKTLEQLQKNGIPLTGNKQILLHMFFKSEPKMLTFAERARLDGFAIGDTEFAEEQEFAHGVTLIQLSSLRKKEIDDITTRAITLAQEYGGILVYWHCK